MLLVMNWVSRSLSYEKWQYRKRLLGALPSSTIIHSNHPVVFLVSFSFLPWQILRWISFHWARMNVPEFAWHVVTSLQCIDELRQSYQCVLVYQWGWIYIKVWAQEIMRVQKYPLYGLHFRTQDWPKLKDWLLKLGIFWGLAMFGEKAMSR